ncbi:MAG: aminomethyl-transferring glycine dehydrogenase subunit GcvPA [Thermodesulfobacteriota bacterium]
MEKGKSFAHPYIPNSAPQARAEMLERIGISEVEELYQEIPERLRFKGRMNLPEPLWSEYELRRHLTEVLSRNRTCVENLNFLGGGCWQHHVPAVCDEIAGRAEFLTAYGGTVYSTFGKEQAFFEFQSQLGELLDMDVVGQPSYSWSAVAGNGVRMAARITGRQEVLVPRTCGPERLAVIRQMCHSALAEKRLEVVLVDYHPDSGLLDLDDLKAKLSSRSACAYIENPSYLGFIETQGQAIADLAHGQGAEFVVGVDPISLGILAPPAHYGADIVVGTAQPLGIHMLCGGGLIGFIASRDEEKYVAEYPGFLITITDTTQPGEYGFGMTRFERTSYIGRDQAKDWLGTVTGLWTITASVYMALMGPQGFKEIGETIVQKCRYAARLLSGIKGLKVRFADGFFKEFVVNFDGVGRSVAQVNKALLDYGIFGGRDLSSEFPELGQSALYCVTEVHSQADLKKLAAALEEVTVK